MAQLLGLKDWRRYVRPLNKTVETVRLRYGILILTLSLAIPAISDAQGADTIYINKIINEDLEPYKPVKGEIFLLVTDKNCLKCYEQACSYLLRKDASAAGKIKLLLVTSKSLTTLLHLSITMRAHAPCVRDVLFYRIQPTENLPLAQEPSPQLIFMTGDEAYRHLNYKETMGLIDN